MKEKPILFFKLGQTKIKMRKEKKRRTKEWLKKTQEQETK